MTDEIKEKLLKGCGKIFGDSFYPDMNPRPCGNKLDIIFLCSDCRKLLKQHEETSKAKDEEFDKILDELSNDVDALQMNYANLDECKKVDVIRLIEEIKQKLEKKE